MSIPAVDTLPRGVFGGTPVLAISPAGAIGSSLETTTAMDFHYDHDNNILKFECDNHIELADLRHAFEVILGAQEYPPDVATLWDCRKLDFEKLDRSFEDKLIALRKMNPERGNAKIAIVVSELLGFGLSRMYEIKSQELPQQMMIFRDIDKALDWLRQ